MSSYSIFNSCYLNNKVTCEKFDFLLYATFGRPLDVQISPLSTRLQWTEKGRPMDVQYGTWTDGPNKDVLWTSFGRAMPIGVPHHVLKIILGVLLSHTLDIKVARHVLIFKLQH